MKRIAFQLCLSPLLCLASTPSHAQTYEHARQVREWAIKGPNEQSALGAHASPEAIQAYGQWIKRADDEEIAAHTAISNQRNTEAVVNAYREANGLPKCSFDRGQGRPAC